MNHLSGDSAPNERAQPYLVWSFSRMRARRWGWAVLIVVIGVTLIGTGFAIEPQNVRPKLWSIILVEVGIAALVAAIAEFGLLEHASREMRGEVHSLLSSVRHDYDIVTHSSENGLTEVLPARRVEPIQTWGAIETELQNARGEVLICGTSLREFLDGAHHTYRTLHKLLTDDEDVDLKFILLDPTSESARMRTKAEQGNISYEKGQLFSNITASMASLRDLCTQAQSKKRFKIDVRFCNSMTAYMIATNGTLFFEAYHLGRLDTDGPCVGGFVPMLRFDSASEMYKRFVQHFKYVWGSLPKNTSMLGATQAHAESDGEFLKVATLDEVESALMIARPNAGVQAARAGSTQT